MTDNKAQQTTTAEGGRQESTGGALSGNMSRTRSSNNTNNLVPPPAIPVWTNLSITGRRTSSGNVDLAISAVGSGGGVLDPSNGGNEVRARLATDTDVIMSHGSGGGGPGGSLTSALAPTDNPSPRARFASDPVEGRRGNSSRQQSDTTAKNEGEEDEEVQRALAMAIAIQNNPGLPPEEIRQLVAQHLRKQAIARAQQMAQLAAAASSAKRTLRERARGLLPGKVGGLSISTGGSADSSGDSITTPTGGGGGNRPRLAVRLGPSRSLRTPPVSLTPTDTPVVPEVDGASVSSPPATTQPLLSSSSSQQIRLAGIAWKRRGGMGKYSTTSAWERRRIELQGSRLLYYLRDASEEADDAASVPTGGGGRMDSNMTLNVSTASGLTDEGNASEGVVVTKRTTWFEQAVQNLAIGTEDPTEPRGFIDLIKEKATVHVAYGHSGAPSPFAISIKVRNETRWKLCFDYHKTQMDWLAALTDVIVQGSVDLYNVQLVQAADPSMQGDGTFFQPPMVHEPPAPGQTANQHRLWMTESYTISSPSLLPVTEHDDAETDDLNIELPVDDEDDDTLDAIPDEAALSSAADKIQDIVSSPYSDSIRKGWVIPERNLLYVAGVLNLALAYARASSTTLEGFWYLVAFANLGMYLCATREPDWRSMLGFLRSKQNVKGVDGSNPGVTKAKRVPTKAAKQQKTAETRAAPQQQLTPGSKAASPGFVPKAGTTTVKLDKPTDPPVNSKNEVFTGWRSSPGESLLVRSHGYLTTKVKVPSPGELYDCVNVDVFESPIRYPDMATRVTLPPAHFADDGHPPKTWRAPDIFIISIALPTDPPKLGRSSSDGGGYTITIYYRMKPSTRDILRRVTADGYDVSKEQIEDPQKSQVNAVRLFEEWCRRAPTDDKMQSRFKIVPNGHNLKEIGIPGWISQYNGKPFLIKRPGQTGFVYIHPEISCMEFDVSLHPFPYLARQAICFMKDTFFKKVLVSFGFVIEGRCDDELPECVIGATQLCYPDPQYAIQAADFFAGTAPRSF